MGLDSDRKQRQRDRRRRLEAVCRFLLSLFLVLVTHALLGGLAWIKLRRGPSPSPESGGGGLRIWSMSESDPLLTVEARDFLALNGLLLEPLPALRIAFPKDGSVGVYTGGSFSDWEREKRALGVRLGWDRFTAVMDDRSSRLGVVPSAGGVVEFPCLGLESGLRLSHDLSLYGLDSDWGIWRSQVPLNWRSEVTVFRSASRLGSVRVSKYENQCWAQVSAPSLAYEASDLLRGRGVGSVVADGSLGQVRIEVFGSPTSGCRVHLRQSSGFRPLDDLSMRWVLERHRHLGHHHTDGISVSGRDRHVDYLIEYGEP